VTSRSRVISALPGAICAVGAATMFGATFLPYVGSYGDGIQTPDEYPNQVYSTLISGSDALFVFGTIFVLAGAAIYHVAGFGRRLNGLTALGASLVAIGLAVKLPGTYLLDGIAYGTPHMSDPGVYVFLGGAAASSIGALLMVWASLVGSPFKAEAPLSQSPS
jgi:hypothetical protein